MLIPVEKVPYEAIIIALFSFSVIVRTSSRSSVSTPPCTKKHFLFSSLLLFMRSNKGSPCDSTLVYKIRVLTFLNPDRDPLGAGYQIIQSKIAIGSGEGFGKGFLKGTQSYLEFLPEKHTDFIFTLFSEEFVFLGSIFLLLIYTIIIYRIIKIDHHIVN